MGVNYLALIKRSLRDAFPEVKKRKDKKRLYKLVSSGAEFELRNLIVNNPELLGTDKLSMWVLADDDVDTFFKLKTKTSRIDDKQAEIIAKMVDNEMIRTSINTTFFSNSDSREPEQAGIQGALLGSETTADRGSFGQVTFSVREDASGPTQIGIVDASKGLADGSLAPISIGSRESVVTLTISPPATSDFDRDGVVGFSDFVAFAAVFGFGSSSNESTI